MLNASRGAGSPGRAPLACSPPSPSSVLGRFRTLAQRVSTPLSNRVIPRAQDHAITPCHGVLACRFATGRKYGHVRAVTRYSGSDKRAAGGCRTPMRYGCRRVQPARSLWVEIPPVPALFRGGLAMIRPSGRPDAPVRRRVRSRNAPWMRALNLTRRTSRLTLNEGMHEGRIVRNQ